ncbi:GMP synthase (glutamine-hydrolysing) [Propionicimonas paludicola]|uniref:GMP synthase (Glutamine-hydrolysing) n=1 Tax=Propionicimonas paludicola TaxID=185243 RepID=A0A2A9CXL3_9ACTN|nr:glutamine amidotransferase [Propionicimonas paludicola]PFG18402.1 GMP synthase (glutamine-hydrolysing) [Propionicimonas paludicola]
MKPFLLIATRDHDQAADDEYRSVLRHTGLRADELERLRLEAAPMPSIDLNDYAGILLGGSPFNVSDTEKSPVQLRVEAELGSLLARVIEADVPFLGMCYGIGIMVDALGGVVDQSNGEPVNAAEVRLTEAGRTDPLLAGVGDSFHAFVAHKEGCAVAPSPMVVLGAGAVCPLQVVRIGRHVYATQFHPELDADELAIRMKIYENAGYFAPDEYAALVAQVKASPVDGRQHLLLRNFVALARGHR